MTPRPSRSETFPYPERVFMLPDGVPVRYFDSDEDTPRARPAVVFIHGLGANLTHFEYVAPVLDAQGFRVLGLDLPGFGLSGKPHRRYTIDYLSAAIPALLDHVGVAQAVLFGHSLGGLCAAATAIRHRERVAALVLASPAGLFAVPGVLRVASRAIFSETVLAPALERNARLLLGRVFWKSNVRTERFVAQSVTRPDARFVADLARVMSQARGDLASRPCDQVLGVEVVAVDVLVRAVLLDDEHGHTRGDERVHLGRRELMQRAPLPAQITHLQIVRGNWQRAKALAALARCAECKRN